MNRVAKSPAGEVISLSRSIRVTLEDEIVTGVLPPGTHLEETVLAERFGASRTPVREALQQLAAAGVIEIRPRRGAIVPQPDIHAVVELFEAMAELEAVCARLAARRLTDEDRAALLAAHDRCREAQDDSADQYYQENEAFHLAIYRASHNRVLEEQTTAMLRRLRPYRRLQLRLPHRVESSLGEHEALKDALLGHDGELAARLARDHVQIQGQGFNDLMILLGSSIRPPAVKAR